MRISVDGLIKEYRVHQRPAGLWAALGALLHREYKISRAVDNLSFVIEPGERVGFLSYAALTG